MIALVAGARPNFMKIVPVYKKAISAGLDAKLVFTNQHQAEEMSSNFLKTFGIAAPDFSLKCTGQTHAETTASIMMAFETFCIEQRPEVLVVPGDVTSTLACSLAARKLNDIHICHLEAGLRSFDRTMPEEINRIVTDHIADTHFASEESGVNNLLAEGISKSGIHFVGNTMIDSLDSYIQDARKGEIWRRWNLTRKGYILITSHRPANVDSPSKLEILIKILRGLSKLNYPVIFPIHPRTHRSLNQLNIDLKEVITCPPLGYLEFIGLMDGAGLVLTDSGGVQEETTALGVPCLTLRDSTERPVTITHGTNLLVGLDYDRVIFEAKNKLGLKDETSRPQLRPSLWDGKASDRVVEVLKKLHSN